MTTSSPIGTTHIGVDQATNIFHAIRYAADDARALNLAVTINWDRLGVSDVQATPFFRQLRQKVRRRWTHLRKTVRPDLGTFDDVGAHENPSGHRNTHWLVRVPASHAAQFRKDVARFLTKVTGVVDLGRGLKFTPVPAAGTFAKYLAKGVDPRYGDYFHIKPLEQGFIGGRGRTFVSRTIGFAARRNADWKRKRRPKLLP